MPVRGRIPGFNPKLVFELIPTGREILIILAYKHSIWGSRIFGAEIVDLDGN
jgi:hypothetical protein